MTARLHLLSRRSTLTRRSFLRWMALGAGGGLLSACGGPTASSGSFATTAPDTKGTLTVWGWEGTTEGIAAQVGAFNTKYPNLTVDIKSMGYDDVHTNLLNAVVAGTGAPDLCAIDVLKLSKVTAGLADLSALAQPYADQFVSPTFSIGSLSGKFYGIATDSEPEGLMYRVDLWDQYGIHEDDIATWDDLVEAGNKLATDSKGEVMLYHLNSDSDYLFQVLALQQGFAGFYFSTDDKSTIVDDPKMIEAAAVFKRLWDGKGVQRNPVGGAHEAEVTALLKNGKLACQTVAPAWYPLQLTSEMPELSGKWRLMRSPAIKAGGPRVGYAWPTLIVMPQQSANQGAAWDLMKMSLIGDGARALYDATAVLPAYKPLLDEIKDQADPYFGGQKINALWDEIARDTPPVTFGVGFDEAQQIVGLQLQAILTGAKTPEEGMRAAAAEIRTKLNKS